MTRRLVRLAYFEFKVARLFTTGNGEKYLDGEDAPGWFFWRELGFGTGETPSLAETLRNLDGTNRRNRRVLEQREGRDARASKRTATKPVARKKAA